jgi:hypothetical protein
MKYQPKGDHVKKKGEYFLILLGLLTLASCSANIEDVLKSIAGSNTDNIMISSPSVPAVGRQSATSVYYQIIYQDISEATLKASDVLVFATDSAACAKSVSNVTNVGAYISFYNCTGSGTVRFQIASGSAIKTTGEPAGASSLSSSFSVDNSGTSSVMFLNLPGLYSALPSKLELAFSGPVVVSSISANAYSLGGSCSGVSIGGVVVADNVATVSLIGSGGCAAGESVVLNVHFDQIADTLGNFGSGMMSATYTVTNF